MEPYGTHIPVLEELIKSCNIKTVFEFGSGLASTPLFVKNCESVHAVEMQSEEWFTKVADELKKYENLDYEKIMGADRAIDEFSKIDKKYDLVFVDGHGSTRWKCINEAFSKTKLIVTHDTETPSYNWHKVVVPKGWSYHVYQKLRPWTTIYYLDGSLDVENSIKNLENK
jgi:hypothetical protein